MAHSSPAAGLGVQMPDLGPALAQLRQDFRRAFDDQWQGVRDIAQVVRSHSRQMKDLTHELAEQGCRFRNRFP